MIHILYHHYGSKTCMDGLGAAYSAWRKFGDDAKYHPVKHGDAWPAELCDQDEVFILDFSYPRKDMELLASRVKKLTVIDHHQSAQEDCAGLDFCIFDMTKSGTVLAWEFFHPGEPLPLLLAYVQDRDLWAWKLPNSRQVSAALAYYQTDFETFNILARNPLMIDKLAIEGTILITAQDVLIAQQIANIRTVNIAGFKVPACNATLFASETGERMLELYKETPFVALYWDRADSRRQWSLRGRPGFDCSSIARKFGGGGHAPAAGFTLTEAIFDSVKP